MACNKTSLTCMKPLQSSACIVYEPELPEFSELDECSNSVQEVLEEHYDLIGKLQEDSELSALGNQCITYPSVDLTLKVVLLAMETKICELQTQYNDLLAQQEIMEQQIQDLQQNNCQ